MIDRLALIALATLSTALFAQTVSSPVPPVAKQIHIERPINGHVLVDDYGWLREKTNPEVLSYLAAENAYAEQLTSSQKPLEEKLYRETISHVKQDDKSVPYRKNGYWYYRRTEEGKQYPIACRKKGTLDAPEEVLLDVNQLARGEKFLSLGAFEVSDDSNQLAYTTDNVGYRNYQLHIKDLRTGRLRRDTAVRVDDVTWAADNKTLFYTTEDAVTKRSNQVYRHLVGANSFGDSLVFQEEDERYALGLNRTRDGKYIELLSASHVTSEVRFLPSHLPQSAWKIIEPRREGVQYYVDEGNDTFYIRVNDTSRNFRVVTVPVARPDKQNWKELIAAREGIPVDDIDVFKDFYVTAERVNGLEILEISGIKDHTHRVIEFPEPAYRASGSLNEEFDTHNFRYSYSSPITPDSIFEYDLSAGTSQRLKQEEVPGYDKSQYAVERMLIPAEDGTQIPVTAAYRKDKFRRGSNPLFVYGYGSYGVNVDDDFSVNDLPLLDRGVIAAVAHVRGGGEFGETWHDGAKLMNKRNTFTDFIDVTEGLLTRGYGKRGQVGIEGASAGGLLMGAVTNMRPDLFKVVLCEVPFVDVMNTMLDPSIPLTVGEYEEWGNPNQKKAFEYMLNYSPYDNVAAKDYPALLVETSLDDSQVGYWEPSKYVAKLRALKTDKNPLVFFVNLHGGHAGSSGRYNQIRKRDRNYAFMLTQLGVFE
ncbi:S9 family peptidase [Edaphobacter aggregans]|uniref:S9 family peptidase n=1 Tax=Edaphobacter aggregans TaxID=570835 RepID=UPI000691F372|nr:S9 family peptidase [Edaphobacter aggregans]